jgi:hypothetical protein
MVKVFWNRETQRRGNTKKRRVEVWDTEDLWIQSKQENLEGYSTYRFGLLKKSAGIRLQVKNFLL